MEKHSLHINGKTLPVISVTTLIVGSGAASLNCADRLHQYGQRDLAIVTEDLKGGTSYNTGSDKQTYYKLAVAGPEPDSPYEMAKALFNGGSMHGDLALIEALGSLEGFYHLASIGVPFPHNYLGAYVGYKTDHDPLQRATSVGPWTSKQMVECLLCEVKRREIPIFDLHDVIALIVECDRIFGVIAIDKTQLSTEHYGLVIFQAENVVFGVGGPGGLYQTSVYPACHLGAIGLALEAGAKAVNLTESQYGLASTKFRWNVSGTYQQVIPRYISTNQAGEDEQEFLNEYFPSTGKLGTAIFLKGYQWPFDPRKIPNYGSSLIDVLVYIETVQKGRRVFMDFRENLRGDGLTPFCFKELEPEAYAYLQRSEALFGTPIERLAKMNPLAIDLYRQHGIDLCSEPLEIAVCAQHNNGGLSGDLWWESNIAHLFPIGEVSGSHGVYRPGGSALNSGQVGALRTAQKIAHCYQERHTSFESFTPLAERKVQDMLTLIEELLRNSAQNVSISDFRQEFQERMTNTAAHIRKLDKVKEALEAAYQQIQRASQQSLSSREELSTALANRQLAIAHAAYLQAIKTYLEAGGGSRGSYLVLSEQGQEILTQTGTLWKYAPEVPKFREQVLETVIGADGRYQSEFKPRRPIPQEEFWFETVWQTYREGTVFQS
ncbi:fumarate reductase/succinate dehydrogenase flavoprotein domain protein [Candidatus Vecturithrix granuli]|uniref:Fumarate reductase/succinate dehydrogenase flavoprotein domain protein n=1 Tax=Vecturithrix granuli TaxID=1499967 RepID=A0A081C959_VECG1|nr:fumarate reductase/succinate dehydrogenase flavoprotein domain protein [Candidatus Vecturithrix granuli]